MRKRIIPSVIILPLIFLGCAASEPGPQVPSRYGSVKLDVDRDVRKPEAHLNKAKRMYLGRRMWKKARTRLMSPRGEYIKVDNLEALHVIDIKSIGNCTKKKACEYIFGLRTKEGKNALWRGYIHEKETINDSLIGLHEGFYLQDPYKQHPEWSDEIWNKIRNQKIAVGMSQKMVLMSWGVPKHIERTVDRFGIHEKWVYEEDERGDLYFENRMLIRHKIVPEK